MTHAYRSLADNVYAAVVGGDLVLLDVNRDAYHCLPDAALGEHLARQVIEGLPEDLAAELSRAGLLVSDGGGGDFPGSALDPARADFARLGAVRPSLAEQLQMSLAVLHMTRHFHGRPLGYLVTRAARRYARTPIPLPAPGPGERRRIEVFRELLPWVPGQGACLYRCVLLLTFLRQAGLDAHWVFGVRTWPFSAHCWLQAGDVVFDDPADYVARFTPILVV